MLSQIECPKCGNTWMTRAQRSTTCKACGKQIYVPVGTGGHVAKPRSETTVPNVPRVSAQQRRQIHREEQDTVTPRRMTPRTDAPAAARSAVSVVDQLQRKMDEEQGSPRTVTPPRPRPTAAPATHKTPTRPAPPDPPRSGVRRCYACGRPPVWHVAQTLTCGSHRSKAVMTWQQEHPGATVDPVAL